MPRLASPLTWWTLRVYLYDTSIILLLFSILADQCSTGTPAHEPVPTIVGSSRTSHANAQGCEKDDAHSPEHPTDDSSDLTFFDVAFLTRCVYPLLRLRQLPLQDSVQSLIATLLQAVRPADMAPSLTSSTTLPEPAFWAPLHAGRNGICLFLIVGPQNGLTVT